MILKTLEWKPFNGIGSRKYEDREYAITPYGEEYHINDEGWWNPMCELHPCSDREAARVASQADFRDKVMDCFVFLNRLISDEDLT